MNRTTSCFAELGPFALFAAHDGTGGYELWRTDGTMPGIVLTPQLKTARPQ